MGKFLLIFFLAVTISANGQDENLVRSLLNNIGLNSTFIYAEKASIFKLDSLDLLELKNEYAMRSETLLLADSIIMQMFGKTTNNIDTSHWSNTYFPNQLLVSNRQKNLDLRDILWQYKIERKTQRGKIIESLVQDWNSRQQDDRPVAYCSNPIFDNSKRYALILYGYSRGNLDGRSWLKIFEFINGVWSEIVFVNSKVS